ncbi:hypothetical protein GU3_00640 [Oceanimonas sp. GK1]|nr:hypothetical protein GU3_00640 [Oceanimonas sp. GK1]
MIQILIRHQLGQTRTGTHARTQAGTQASTGTAITAIAAIAAIGIITLVKAQGEKAKVQHTSVATITAVAATAVAGQTDTHAQPYAQAHTGTHVKAFLGHISFISGI